MPLIEGGAADLLKEDLFSTCRLKSTHLSIVGLVCGGEVVQKRFFEPLSGKARLAQTRHRGGVEGGFNALEAKNTQNRNFGASEEPFSLRTTERNPRPT